MLIFSKKCQIPNNPPHTKYQLADETETKHQPGDYAQDYDIIEITCDNEYNLKPFAQNYSICINDNWYPPLTKCLRKYIIVDYKFQIPLFFQLLL